MVKQKSIAEDYGPEGVVFLVLTGGGILLLKWSVELSVVVGLVGFAVVLGLRKGWFGKRK